MITSVSNAKIKNVMQLNQKAKARREQGLFVAEGRKMFLEAPESWVFQVFVSETVSRDGELMSQAEKYPCEIVKDSVFESTTGIFRIRGRRTQDGDRIDFSSYEPKRT